MLSVLLLPERDKIIGNKRVKFHFVQITPENANSYVFLLKSYCFRVLMRPSRFLLQFTSNKWSNKGPILFCPINFQKCQFLCVLTRKLRFSSPHEAIEIPSASNFK